MTYDRFFESYWGLDEGLYWDFGEDLYTDDELYAVTIAHIDKEYKRSQIKLLSPEQKIDTARHLRFKYNATNNQIRRILKIEISLLEEMFPTGL